MAVHLFHSDGRHVPTPAADDRGHDPRVDETLDPPICIVEIYRVNADKVLFVRHSSFVFPTRIKGRLVRIRSAADDLDHAKALGLAVGRKFLKAFPGQPFAQAFPPGITQPEEWRAISMFKVPVILGHADRSVVIQRVVARVRHDFDFPFSAVQAQDSSYRNIPCDRCACRQFRKHSGNTSDCRPPRSRARGAAFHRVA